MAGLLLQQNNNEGAAPACAGGVWSGSCGHGFLERVNRCPCPHRKRRARVAGLSNQPLTPFMVFLTHPEWGLIHPLKVNFTMNHSPLLADLATDLPQAVRLQQLEEDPLRPVAVEGLVREALGRRFVVSQHPRLAAILARREVTCFDHDSTPPDPSDGLLDTLVGEPLPVHDCMGVSLWVDGKAWGVLTLDALQTGTFGEAARAALADCKVLVEAAVRISRLEREVQALRSAPHTRRADDERTTRAGGGGMGSVGPSEPLLRLLHELEVVAGSDLPVLLLGETGVGKELFARLLH